ncbi:hypothetical protein [Amycolatopsis benzoatilytica]|uniref:hypothetical protein n=1 Tax=Amycolatopsis benzoatilytica TaxID=346045 RepID=UPI000375C47C|nr:hypothetical protein [Amycolatopsis benzoatilytica]
MIDKDVAGLDPQAGGRFFEGFVTGTVTVDGVCEGHGKYCSETRVLGTGLKVQSARAELC